jgi:hypothetical protein
MNDRCSISIIVLLLPLFAGCASPLNTQGIPLSIPTPSTSILVEYEESEILVYFTNSARYALGIQPFETPVIRRVPAYSNLPRAVLEEFFRGPTLSERELDLEAVTSGFTGLRALEINNGYAHVYLEGNCHSSGATYTIAQPILRNLAQFPEIQFVKIYDEHGNTGDPQSAAHSIPFCLEP